VEIKYIDTFRDGGTIHVKLHDGREFFVDRRSDTMAPMALYDAYPLAELAQLDDPGGAIASYFLAILNARTAYKNQRAEQRGTPNSQQELDAFRAHRKEDMF
jgi:hypothetical protein